MTYLALQGGLSVALYLGLAQALPAREFAPAAVALGLLVVVQGVADLGLSPAAVTALPAKLASATADRPGLLAGAAMSFYVAAGCALILVVAAAPFMPPTARLPLILIAPAAAGSVLVSGADGLLRATGEFSRPIVLVGMSRVLALAGIPVAVASESAPLACAAVSGGVLLGAVPAGVLLGRYTRRGSRESAGSFFRASLPLGAANLFMILATRFNTALLGVLGTVSTAAAFESAWRLFQLPQYLAGAIATGAAPVIANSLGGGRRAEFVALLRRVMLLATLCGAVLGAALFVTRDFISRWFFGQLGPSVADAVVPLAAVTPIAFAGFLATFVLAGSEEVRARLVQSYGLGAAVNIGLALLLIGKHGALGAAVACAAGLTVASAGVLLMLWRGLDRSGGIAAPEPVAAAPPPQVSG